MATKKKIKVRIICRAGGMHYLADQDRNILKFGGILLSTAKERAKVLQASLDKQWQEENQKELA